MESIVSTRIIFDMTKLDNLMQLVCKVMLVESTSNSVAVLLIT